MATSLDNPAVGNVVCAYDFEEIHLINSGGRGVGGEARPKRGPSEDVITFSQQ